MAEQWLVNAAAIGLMFGIIAGVSYAFTGTNWLAWSMTRADEGQVV